MGASHRATQGLLFGVFLFTIPVPYYLGSFEVAPAARLVFLSGLVLGVVATEGTAGYQGAFALLATVQALLWPAILWGVAVLSSRALHRLVPGPRGSAALLGLCLALLALSLLPIYATELSSRGPTSNLAGLLD
ncbi:MAG: hypothetical protein ABFS46_10200 [Myxococcota bacterium]